MEARAYRTRGTRGIRWAVTIGCTIFTAAIVFAETPDRAAIVERSPGAAAFILGVLVVSVAYMHVGLARSGLVLEDGGLRVRSSLRSHRYGWDEIDRVEISDVAEINALIARHRPAASPATASTSPSTASASASASEGA